MVVGCLLAATGIILTEVVITPHSAWLTPHSFEDTRKKSAETMRAALLTNRPQNVITPEMF